MGKSLSDYASTHFKTLAGEAFKVLKNPSEFLSSSPLIAQLDNLDAKGMLDVFFGKKSLDIGNIKEKFGEYIGHSAKLLSSVAIAEGTSYLGPAAIPVAEILQGFSDQAITNFTGHKTGKNFHYERGDWVIVDLGKQKKLNKKALLEEAYLEGGMFGDFDAELAVDFEQSREDYSLGFFMSKSNLPGESMIFVFEHKATDSVRDTHIEPATASQKKKYDASFEYAGFREIFLQKEELGSLIDNVKTPLEPGTEVVYDDKIFHIVSGNFEKSIIQDMSGKNIMVDVRDLSPGRHKTTGVYIYEKNLQREYFNPDFFKSADFVWLPVDTQNKLTCPDAERILSVISYFYGNEAVCYECFNGRERNVRKSELQALSDEYFEFVNRFKQFKLFQSEAIQNSTLIVNFGLGGDYAKMCHGLVTNFGVSIYKENVSTESQMRSIDEPKALVVELPSTPQIPDTRSTGTLVYGEDTTGYDEELDLTLGQDDEDAEKSKELGNGIYIGLGVIGGVILVTYIYKTNS